MNNIQVLVFAKTYSGKAFAFIDKVTSIKEAKDNIETNYKKRFSTPYFVIYTTTISGNRYIFQEFVTGNNWKGESAIRMEFCEEINNEYYFQ